jgi:endonuclease IV
MTATLRRCAAVLGKGRVRSLHLNDSQTPLGSNRDRHANIGAGELGESGCSAFLAAPSLQRLPCVLETPVKARLRSSEHVAADPAEPVDSHSYRHVCTAS